MLDMPLICFRMPLILSLLPQEKNEWHLKPVFSALFASGKSNVQHVLQEVLCTNRPKESRIQSMRRRIRQISSLCTLSCLLSLKMNPSLASFSAPASSNHKSKSIRDLVAPDPPPGLHPVYEDEPYDSLQRTPLLVKTPTRLNYVAPETVRATVKRDPSGYDSETTGAIWQEETVWVENGRRRRPRYELDPNGFELVPNDPVSREIDFTSKDDVLDNYYPHCEQLLERYLMGSSSTTAAPKHDVTVKAFDHNVRKQLPADGETIMKPLGLVHGDYTATSAPRRIQLLAEPPRINDVRRETTPLLDPSIVAECLAGKRRFALINVWRNIDPEHPVQSFPLACMDAQTYTRDDLRVLELHYKDRIGENFLACPAAGDRLQHRWIYFPEMHYDEALLIKQWDSLGSLARGKESDGDDDDTGIATMSIHSAFLDPCTTENAPARQSIEVRCVAIWEPSK